MRKEIENWLEQSKEDFISAQYNFNGKKFYVCAFLCQQSVEKALKALFLFEKKGEVPQSHSLIYLAINTSIPIKFHSFLRELTSKYVDTRYPDASVDIPSRLYDAENTKRIFDKSEEVLIWINQKMK
ncbi:MAG: HEPN domain-containing protein [archaeon]